jgi:hypothetical protein
MTFSSTAASQPASDAMPSEAEPLMLASMTATPAAVSLPAVVLSPAAVLIAGRTAPAVAWIAPRFGRVARVFGCPP